MVEYITYKGKKYAFRVSYYALKKTVDELKEKGIDSSMNNILNGDLSVYEPLLYYSLVSGAKATDKELDLKREDIVDVLDECFLEFTKKLPNFFQIEQKKKGG